MAFFTHAGVKYASRKACITALQREQRRIVKANKQAVRESGETSFKVSDTNLLNIERTGRAYDIQN